MDPEGDVSEAENPVDVRTGKTYESPIERLLGGRPTILNDDLIRRITRHLSWGCYVETACNAEGVTDRAYQKWVNKGIEADEKGETPSENVYLRFVRAVKISYADAESEILAELRKAKNMRANLAWILERTRNAKYAQKQQLEIHTTVTAHLNAPTETPMDYTNWVSTLQKAKLLPKGEEK